MADELAVWLYGERVATVDRKRGRPRLAYTEEALGRYDLGTPLLSLALPVGAERYTQGVARPFLDGLLPEGEPRKSIARDLGLRPDDTSPEDFCQASDVRRQRPAHRSGDRAENRQ